MFSLPIGYMENVQSECSAGRLKQQSAPYPPPRLSNVHVSREKPGPGLS